MALYPLVPYSAFGHHQTALESKFNKPLCIFQRRLQAASSCCTCFYYGAEPDFIVDKMPFHAKHS